MGDSLYILENSLGISDKARWVFIKGPSNFMSDENACSEINQ